MEVLAAAVLGGRRSLQIRRRAHGTERLKHSFECDAFGKSGRHAFFIGYLQLAHVVFPATEDVDFLFLGELPVLDDFFGAPKYGSGIGYALT